MEPAERIISLDVLRGLALLGMLIVHLHDHAAEGGGLAATIQTTLIEKLVSERAYATFAFLFGAGFAVQLERARRRARPFTKLYLRRLAVLALFGIIAHAVFGFPVLLGYALWGLVLLPLARLSIRGVVTVAVLATFSRVGYSLVQAIDSQGMTSEQVVAGRTARVAEFQSAWRLLDEAREQPTLAAAIPYRVTHMAWFHQQPFFLYYPPELALFLWGLLAVRLGALTHPGRHRGLVAGAGGVGLLAWIASEWFLPLMPKFEPSWLSGALLSIRLDLGLMFFYVAVTLLLLAAVPKVAGLLRWFAWPGRAALTIYFVQIIGIDLVVSRYGLGLGQFPSWVIIPGATGVFVLLLFLSRWWLVRHRFGPLEWIWRTLTYGHRPPILQSPSAMPVAVGPVPPNG